MRDGPMRGGMDGAPDEMRMRRAEMIRAWLEIVDRYSKLSSDPDSAGIAAVVSAGDILRPRGADAAIEYFNKLLPEAKSPSVQRAIRLQLVDLYKNAGQGDKALEVLHDLIVAPVPNSAGGGGR